jgi:DNA-binding response OmpR family regulator
MIKILIVNADKEFTEDIKINFEMYQQDCTVTSINSGTKCLDILNSKDDADIVIVGSNLPDMPSLDLIRQIRDDSDVIIVLISQYKDLPTLVKAFEVGANDCVAQPANMFLFVTRLKTLLRRQHWDKQARENKRFRNACH